MGLPRDCAAEKTSEIKYLICLNNRFFFTMILAEFKDRLKRFFFKLIWRKKIKFCIWPLPEKQSDHFENAPSTNIC